MSYKGRIKKFNLYQVSGSREDNTRTLVGVGLPFTGRAKGITLLFDNGLKLIVYPIENYNPKQPQFDVCSVEEQNNSQHRLKVGTGYKFKSGKGYGFSVSYQGVAMELILLPA